TVRGVVRPDACAGREIEQPKNIGVERPGRKCRGDIVRGHVSAFGAEWAVIAVGQSQRVQAQHLTPVADDIYSVVLYSCGRGNAAVWPIKVNVLFTLRHNELPKERAGLFIETHQDPAVTLVLGVARISIVSTDVDTAVSNYWRGVSFGSQGGRPFDIS